MGIIDAYLPIDRRQALARNEHLPDRTSGAVLFADISGFTRFSHALEKEIHTPLSVEVLTEHLDRVYSALIAEVHRYRGSVISFGGDSITCWFDQDPGHRATAAGLDMQKVIGQLESLVTPSGTRYPIGIKVSVTAGAARRFLVGLPRIQRIEVLAGAILDRMSAAEKQLKSGDVVVGSEVMGRLGNQAEVKEWRKNQTDEYYAVIERLTQPVPPQPWKDLPEIDHRVARDWLLPTIYERLLRGEGEFLAELRPALAMFIKFNGIDYDDDDRAGEKLDDYVRWIQTVLERYEGLLLNLTIGDKGSYIYCSFGALVSHENEVDLALTAAEELVAPPAEMKYIRDIRIGITRGQMRVGSYGAPNRRTYGAYGSEVNLAARLMTLAKPGQILTSSRIVKDASVIARFDELGPITVRGIDEPFPVFTLTGLTPHRKSDQGILPYRPLIGREKEKALIAQAIRELPEGPGGALVIEGEAGIGKTKLVEHLLYQPNQTGIITLTGTGEEIGRSSLYYPWRPVFRKLLALDQIPEGVDRHDLKSWSDFVQQRFEHQAPDISHLSPLLNEILQTDIPENDLTRHMSGEVRGDNVHTVTVNLIHRIAENAPVMLVLEDAHWFDSASWSVVLAVSREVNPLLLVISHRPLADPVPEEYSEILTAPGTRRISLNLFTMEEIRDFILQMLDIKDLPEPLLKLIYEKGEGNPFFSEELVIALQQRGLIKIEPGECQPTTTIDNLLTMDFPETSQDVIRSRIDRLTPGEQLTLKIASTLGRNFSYRILHDIHPVESDREMLISNLQSLEHLALIHRINPEPDLEYAFKHNIIQEVAYNLMLFTQRRELHGTIAQWYEDNYCTDLAQVYPLLAHHWNQTDCTDKAVEFLVKAGRQAMRNFANREAVAFLCDALSKTESYRMADG